jgi:hypothetical protein
MLRLDPASRGPKLGGGMVGSSWNPWWHSQARWHGEEGDETDGRSPHVSEGRERKHRG